MTVGRIDEVRQDQNRVERHQSGICSSILNRAEQKVLGEVHIHTLLAIAAVRPTSARRIVSTAAGGGGTPTHRATVGEGGNE